MEGIDQMEHLEDPTKEGSDQQTTTRADQGAADQTLAQPDEMEVQTDRTGYRGGSNNSEISSEPGTVDQEEPRLSQVDQTPEDVFETRLFVISQLVEDLYNFREFDEFKFVVPEIKESESEVDHEERIDEDRNPLLESINQIEHICKELYRNYVETKKDELVVDPLIDIGNFPSHISKEIDTEEQIGVIGEEKSDERLIGYQCGLDNEDQHRLKYKELISYYNFLDKKTSEYQGALESRMFNIVTKYMKLLYKERSMTYSVSMKQQCMARLDEYEKQRDEVVVGIKRVVDETTVERPSYLASLDEEFKGDAGERRSELEERKDVNSTIERINWMIEESRKAANNRCGNSIKQSENDDQPSPQTDSSLDESPLDPADEAESVPAESDPAESDDVPENEQELEARLLVVGKLLNEISSICEFKYEPAPSENCEYRAQLRQCFVLR